MKLSRDFFYVIYGSYMGKTGKPVRTCTGEATAQRRKKMDQSQNRKKYGVNSHTAEKWIKRVAFCHISKKI